MKYQYCKNFDDDAQAYQNVQFLYAVLYGKI